MEMRVRPMLAADVPAVFRLQSAVYPVDYHEPASALASRLARGGEGCLLVLSDVQLLAYVLSHPWAGEPPPLHLDLPPCGAPDHLFLHDLAVDPAARGQGAAASLLRALALHALSCGLAHMRLVAVGQAAHFWRHHGFTRDALCEPHASYGEGVAMTAPCARLADYWR